MAALAVVFREHSLELAVEEPGVAAMSRAEQRRAYGRAQASSLITLKLHGAMHVPVRLVPRGQESFVSWMDDYVESD